MFFILGRDWGHIGMFGEKYIGSPEEFGITTIFKNCAYHDFDLTLTKESGVCITSTINNLYYVLVFGN